MSQSPETKPLHQTDEDDEDDDAELETEEADD